MPTAYLHLLGFTRARQRARGRQPTADAAADALSATVPKQPAAHARGIPPGSTGADRLLRVEAISLACQNARRRVDARALVADPTRAPVQARRSRASAHGAVKVGAEHAERQ